MKIQIVFAPLPEEERDVERSAAMEFAVRTAEQFRNATITTHDVVEICHLADWDKNKFMASSSPLLSPKNNSNDNDDDDDDDDDKDVEDDVVIGGGNTVIVFLISCGPDGSVHRSVRKTTKWLKEQQQQQQQQIESEEEEQSNNTNHQEERTIITTTTLDNNKTKTTTTTATTTTTTTTAVIALLGHSVCKTSAEQMADEVFSSGRRLAKSIQKSIVVRTPLSASSSTATATATASVPKFLLETQIELEPPEEKFDGWVESILGSVIATAGKI